MENKRSVTVVAALVREGNKFLIGQRPEGKARAGMWEFIGGKTEPNDRTKKPSSASAGKRSALR